MSNVEKKLNEMGIQIPNAPAPAANYVPYVITGNQIFVSGQIPIENGEFKYQGIVGDTVDFETAKKSAVLCAVNILSQVKHALDGDLDRVTKIVKVGGFVNAVAGYEKQPAVIDAASELFVNIFGEQIGKHARAAVGAGSLPFNVSVEIDCVIEFK